MQMAESDTCPHCGRSTNYEGNPMHLPAGCVVHGAHPYVIGAALGQGGFGITYIALDMVTGVRVAIKEFFPTFCSGRTGGSNVMPYQGQEESFSKGKARFLEEAQVLKSLSDLNCVVNVLDFFQFNNSAYLVMEFLEGSSLKGYVKKEGRLPADMLFRQIRPLMEDIHRMHQRGVVHRDIAPDNIIVLPNGSMKLIDFGAARSFFGDKSMTVVVKKGFAPVEQYMSKGTSAATDVYALAATIYYCITGTVPLDSAERQYDGTVLQSPNTLGAKLTPAQEKALSRALDIQQKTRTQSVQDFLNDLDAHEIIPESTQKSVPESNTAKAPAAPKKKFPAIAASIAIVLILLGGYFLFSGKEPEQPLTTEPPVSIQAPVSTEAPVEETYMEATVAPTLPQLKILSQPADAYARKDQRISVEISADGEGLSYQWWYAYKDSQDFSPSSITSALYTTIMNKQFDGMKVYCVVTDCHGNQQQSNTVTLSQYSVADQPITIVKQPKNVTAAAGETVVVVVDAAGDGLQYQWWLASNSEDTSFEATSEKSNVYIITMDQIHDGLNLLCVITDSHGNRQTSEIIAIKMAS